MQFIKNFLSIAILACTFSLFSVPAAKAQGTTSEVKFHINVDPQAAAYIKFDGVDGECTAKEGRNVVGENTRTGEKLIVVVKNGMLTAFGFQPARGSFKAVAPSASPCFTISCTTFNPPKCFPLPNGGCVCICGPWITSNSGGN